jgi:hypothetical protein
MQKTPQVNMHPFPQNKASDSAVLTFFTKDVRRTEPMRMHCLFLHRERCEHNSVPNNGTEVVRSNNYGVLIAYD